MRRHRPSLVLRLALAYGLVALVLVGGSSLFLYRSLAQAAWQDDVEDVQHASRLVTLRMNDEGEADADVLDVEAGVLVRVQDASGRTLIESKGMASLSPTLFLPPSQTPTKLLASDGSRWITVVEAWKGGTVAAAKNLSGHARLLDGYQDTLLANALLVTLLSILAGWLIARRGLAPLGRLAEATAGIHATTLATRLDPEEAPAELERLVLALNGALARLEEAFTRLTTLSADMAHELRTPLHALRLELESLMVAGPTPAVRDRLGDATESLDHMSTLVEQMLFLARAEDPATALAIQDLDLLQTLKDAARPFELLAEEEGIPLRVEGEAGVTLQADSTLVRRAIHNLLANALRHTIQGEVSLRGYIEAGAAVIEVRDTGEGIPQVQLSKLGQRFLRLDASRSRATGGTGLGLAIVESILRLHGGTLTMDSVVGEGTVVRLRFPPT